jgi:hypothetical protein
VREHRLGEVAQLGLACAVTPAAREIAVAYGANGFGTVEFSPNATKCTIKPWTYHSEYSTSTPQTRNVNAAHTYNIAFSDEIGHFEECGRVNTKSPIAACAVPLGPDTNNGDVGPDPAGDDDFCLPASQSLPVKVNGCVDIDGDFDSVSYTDSWPGSISNATADRLLLLAGGGPYIPGTTHRFGGSAHAEFGPLRVIDYPAAPFGTITKRSNDFRSNAVSNPCRAG